MVFCVVFYSHNLSHFVILLHEFTIGISDSIKGFLDFKNEAGYIMFRVVFLSLFSLYIFRMRIVLFYHQTRKMNEFEMMLLRKPLIVAMEQNII